MEEGNKGMPGTEQPTAGTEAQSASPQPVPSQTPDQPTAAMPMQPAEQPTAAMPSQAPDQATAAMPQQPADQFTAPMPTQQMPPAPDQTDAPVPPAPGQPGTPAPPAPVSAGQPSPTGALVCGILAIVFCFIPIVGIVLGIVAIVLAGKYFKAGGTQGQGKAGRICGIVGLILSIIMIIVNCVLLFTTLSILDNYGVTERSVVETTTSSASSSSRAATSTEFTAEEQEVFDVVNPELDKIKNQDPEVVAVVAKMIEESFDETMSTEGLSFANLGIDATALAKSMMNGFEYTPAFASVVDDEATASYDVICKDEYTILSEFSDATEPLLDNAEQFTTTEEVYAALGKALMDAVNKTPAEDDGYLSLGLTKEGSSWVINQKSWEEALEDLFGGL